MRELTKVELEAVTKAIEEAVRLAQYKARLLAATTDILYSDEGVISLLPEEPC